MKKLFLILFAVFIFPLDSFSFSKRRTPPKSFESSGKASVYLPSVDSTVYDFMKKNKVSALSLALTLEGRLVYAKGYRYSSTPEKKIIPESVFLWASLTKPITWTYTLMKMDQSQGNFHGHSKMIEQLGSSYVSYGDSKMFQITIDHLLFHQAGFDRNISGDPINKKFSTREERLKWVLSRTLDFTPGEKQVYSNLGYQLLSKIHEKRENKKYFSLLQSEIFQKLRMKRTFKTISHQKSPLEVDYEKNPHIYEISHMDGSGDLKGSVLDYAKFLASVELENTNPLFEQKNSFYEMQAIPAQHTGRMNGVGSMMFRDLGVNHPGSMTILWNQDVKDEEYTELKKNLKRAFSTDSLQSEYERKVPRDLFPCFGTPSYFHDEHCTRNELSRPQQKIQTKATRRF